MFLSSSRIRWGWGGIEENITAVGCWRNWCFYVPVRSRDYQLTSSEQILTIVYGCCHYASFLTVSFIYNVPPKNSIPTDEFLQTFKHLCGKSHFFPPETDWRLLSPLIPCNLWLHKDFCFCRLGNGTTHEMSSSEGEAGEAVSVKSAVLNVTLQPWHGRRGFMAEYVWIKLCWVISFINLHKNLIKK